MRYRVNFDIDIPVPARDDEVRAWLAFQLHAVGSIPASNPLLDHDIEPVFGSLVVHRIMAPPPQKQVDSEFGPL